MSTKTDEERATETWSLIYSGLVKDGVKLPNNFDGIGAAYGGYARLIEALTTLRKEQEEAIAHTAKHQHELGRLQGRKEILDEWNHEQRKMLDGLEHPKDCLMCFQQNTETDSPTSH